MVYPEINCLEIEGITKPQSLSACGMVWNNRFIAFPDILTEYFRSALGIYGMEKILAPELP